jgi:uncharacterized protein
MSASAEWWTDVQMLVEAGFHIRALTLGISTIGCKDGETLQRRIEEGAAGFLEATDQISRRSGVPVLSKRLAVSPVTLVGSIDSESQVIEIANALDESVGAINARYGGQDGVGFVGGFCAFVQEGVTKRDDIVLRSLPIVLTRTRHLCAAVNVAATRSGINLNAIGRCSTVLKELSDAGSLDGCARFVVTCNAPSESPYMPGAFHGIEQADRSISIGIGGPGVIKRLLDNSQQAGFETLAREIQATTCLMAQAGERLAREVAQEIGAEFGAVDLSLAPTIEPSENSVASMIEALGVVPCGAPGTTAALAFILNAVKKGGSAGCSHSGGLSGAFLPVSEDARMVAVVKEGKMTISKLEALSAICSVGLDMLGIPGDTPASTIGGIIADEIAIGVANNKTTAARIIPVPGAQPGDLVDLQGYNPLFGKVMVMPVTSGRCDLLFSRALDSRVPAPYRALTN